METKVYYLNQNEPDEEILKIAAKEIINGGTVAFPTETVYGLGANALDEKAAAKIFAAKGRPQDNPLIIHVADKNIEKYVKHVPDSAKLLMEKFWPGPLTIILKKADIIPDVITAGLDSVAIRMPNNSIAAGLIRLSKVPIAAPSANISGRPSPTSVYHVINDLYGKIDVILGGEECRVGVESTVVDLTGKPTILRPGGITYEQLKDVLGDVDIDPAVINKPDKNLKPKAPGMKYTHYSPKADMFIVNGDVHKATEKIKELVLKYQSEGKKVGVMATDETYFEYKSGIVLSMGSRRNMETIAHSIFDRLREFDIIGVDLIIAEGVGEEDLGFAIMNRMKKAAGYSIINV